ncbi:hypothetical protein KKF91_15980 [Myxococcota bacterium]|nr:hypothetical protein [Myxococcota bacterium]MBU1432041.1 hypothetical protein [Myxococcota bacterium]MBU1899025.1 hypothetical protein [Myxococcota bacterium]
MFNRIRRMLGLSEPETINLPEQSQPAPIEGEHLLIFSDLHLGEACKEHSRIEYLKRGARLDEDVCAFLEYHTKHRPDDARPWRLIVAGDFIDFLQITLTPSGTKGLRRRYGLGTREKESIWKLERLIERHRRVFVYLADFVGAGNRLEIVQGNHDVELFWPGVRAALVCHLVDLYFGNETAGQGDPEAFRARVHFNAWFYFQRGLVYVEHGHRFDPYCATPPQLCPLKPQAEGSLTTPLSGLAIRFVANLEKGFTTHDKEHWGVGDYYRYYRVKGYRAMLEAIWRYVNLLTRAVEDYIEHGRFESPRAASEHEAGKAALTTEAGMSRAQIEALDKQSARQINASAFALFATLGGGEVSAALLTALGALSPALLGLRAWWSLGGGLLALLLGVGLARAVRRRFPTDPIAPQRARAPEISRLLNVPFVVMGHTHAPERRRLTHNHHAFYINTGSFLPTDAPPHAPHAPCSCPQTFAVIAHPAYGRPIPELKRWCRAASAPVPYRR